MTDWNSETNLKDQLSFNGNQKIWAIGGGKGGVGKSLVTANLSICLSLMGYKVVAIDLDLGGANLHTCLGVPIPEKTLSDYLSKIRNLDADFVLMDLGAGTTFNTLDFFISADQGILTALPEPTSIENTYRFIKSVYHRKLKMAEDLLEVGPLIDQAMNARLNNNATPSELIEKVIEINPQMGHKLKAEIQSFIPKLVINQVRTQADIDIGFSMKIICKKYFGINLDYIGYLEYDATVWQSVKKRRPLLMEFPNSALVSNFDRIVHRLLKI